MEQGPPVPRAAAPVGALYRYSSGQSEPLTAQISDLIVPNGLAFSPDGRTMYASDSHPLVQQIYLGKKSH